jgi:heme/copper-type cytochrome/quinol oxidase subunit 2
MIKIVLVFLLVFAAFYYGIKTFNKMTKAEKWDFAKTFSYSMALSLVVVTFLVSIVVLF